MTRKFTIGFNGYDNFVEKVVIPFKENLSSIYAVPPPSDGIPNARWKRGYSESQLLNLRRSLREHNIEFNLVFNFDGVKKPGNDFTKKLIECSQKFDPDMVTFCGTYVLDAFIEHTDYRLNISVIYDINSIDKLEFLLERDKKNQIVSYNIARRRTYDLDFIRSVRARFPNLQQKLMVNEGCFFECPDQNFHSCSNTMTEGKDINLIQRVILCSKLTENQVWRFFTGQYIPPKFLHHWDGLVDEFKLGTRGHSTAAIVEILKEYVEEEDITLYRAAETSHGGNGWFFALQEMGKENMEKLKIPYPENFFAKRSSCGNDCYRCNYCQRILADEEQPSFEQDAVVSTE